jgi:hypothetical protein
LARTSFICRYRLTKIWFRTMRTESHRKLIFVEPRMRIICRGSKIREMNHAMSILWIGCQEAICVKKIHLSWQWSNCARQ